MSSALLSAREFSALLDHGAHNLKVLIQQSEGKESLIKYYKGKYIAIVAADELWKKFIKQRQVKDSDLPALESTYRRYTHAIKARTLSSYDGSQAAYIAVLNYLANMGIKS